MSKASETILFDDERERLWDSIAATNDGNTYVLVDILGHYCERLEKQLVKAIERIERLEAAQKGAEAS